MNYIITRCDNPDELYHFGVKGMKWGKRKATSAGVSTLKKLANPDTYLKKDRYQKSKNPIGVTLSKDGYKKQKLPYTVKSEHGNGQKKYDKAEKKYDKDLKTYQKAKGYQSASKYISDTYNKPGVNPMVRSKESARAAKYQRRADKLIKSISKESMNRIKTDENKAKIEKAKKYAEQRELFKKHMDSVIEESKHGNTARYPGL